MKSTFIRFPFERRVRNGVTISHEKLKKKTDRLVITNMPDREHVDKSLASAKEGICTICINVYMSLAKYFER